ncbi:hypothetical protein WEI85_16025 [Actinomycetes bacterium KLBMP 9797]
MLPDPRQRARHREEWLADVTGAADLDLSPLRVALGAVGAAARLAATSSKGSMIMQPVGPLALAMRLVGGSHARQRAVALAALLTLTLLGGLTLLITS